MSDDFFEETPAEAEPAPEAQAEAAVPNDLENKLADAQKKAIEYFDQLLRLKAEFENFRRRTEREKSDARQWGKQDVLMPLLNLVDVFEQALSQAKNATDVQSLVQGLGFLHKGFSEFLKTEGLEPIETVGKPFDPHLAEAVEQIEVDEDQVGKVLGEIQRGYLFQGKVMRPSRVRVGVARKNFDQQSDLSETTA